MVAFDIYTNVQSEIIGDPEFITVTIQGIFGISVLISTNRIGDWPSGLINKISRKAIPLGEFIIENCAEIVRLVEIGSEKFAIIHPFIAELTIQFDECP